MKVWERDFPIMTSLSINKWYLMPVKRSTDGERVAKMIVQQSVRLRFVGLLNTVKRTNAE